MSVCVCVKKEIVCVREIERYRDSERCCSPRMRSQNSLKLRPKFHPELARMLPKLLSWSFDCIDLDSLKTPQATSHVRFQACVRMSGCGNTAR